MEFESDLFKLDDFAKKLANLSKVGDIYLLKGDLGSGKTTFARSFINSIFDIKNLNRPNNIKSPSFPIMINYDLLDYEINHYDLYRLENVNELMEIEIFEEIKKNIFIIEWPEILLENFNLANYYLIEFKIINLKKRLISLKHSKDINLNVF